MFYTGNIQEAQAGGQRRLAVIYSAGQALDEDEGRER